MKCCTGSVSSSGGGGSGGADCGSSGGGDSGSGSDSIMLNMYDKKAKNKKK